MTVLRLGSRGSLLALAQSRTVGALVEASGGATVELEVIKTSGDEQQDRPLPEIGGKGLFTQELDQALLEDRIQLAVHSLKDLPTELREGLRIAAIPARADPRDVLVGPPNESVTLTALRPGTVVGTSSPRRAALLRAFCPGVVVKDIRGNVDTRLRKVDEGDYEAIVLAGAGLIRLGLQARAQEWLERTAWLPAPGQGALAVVTRADDRATLDAVSVLNDAPTEVAVRAERSFLAELEGGCRLPIGALGLPYEDGLRLWGLVASPDGTRLIRADITGHVADPEELGRRLADLLRGRGAEELLNEAADLPEPGDAGG